MSEPETRFIPVARWNDFHPWPTVKGLRWRIFHAKSNGLAESGAIKKVGRRVLIDERRFFQWLESEPAPQKMRV